MYSVYYLRNKQLPLPERSLHWQDDSFKSVGEFSSPVSKDSLSIIVREKNLEIICILVNICTIIVLEYICTIIVQVFLVYHTTI